VPVWLLLVFAVPVALCGLEDLRRRVVPNALTLPLLAAGLAWGVARGPWPEALLGLAVGAAVGVGGWLVGGLGGGDAKLMMALGAWLGPGPALAAFSLAALAGAAWGAAVLARRGPLRERLLCFVRGLYLFPALGLWGLAACGWRGPEDPGAVPFAACLAGVVVPVAVVGLIWV
jgi:Flp pilus assembly protein protease CpaA